MILKLVSSPVKSSIPGHSGSGGGRSGGPVTVKEEYKAMANR